MFSLLIILIMSRTNNLVIFGYNNFSVDSMFKKPDYESKMKFIGKRYNKYTY